MNLRIGVVQLNPKIGQVQANIARARELCRKLQPKSLDILCFPEMAFSGYVFENADAISPHLEDPRTGPTSQFCASLAKNLECYVLAGYPEKLSDEEEAPPLVLDDDWNSETGEDAAMVEKARAGAAESEEQVAVGANSACLYDPRGEWVGGYRKTNLYTTDKTWAKPGTGFATFELPPPLQTTSIGICMDLNTMPGVSWTSLEDGPYELAEYAVKKNTKVLFLVNNWLLSSQPPPSDREDDGKHDWNTLEYWATRLRPLWARDRKAGAVGGGDGGEGEKGDETIVVVCNRSGVENGITFAGTSCIFSMVRNSGRPKLLDMMEKDEEGIRVWNITI